MKNYDIYYFIHLNINFLFNYIIYYFIINVIQKFLQYYNLN